MVPIRLEEVNDRIVEIRGVKALLDSDVADLYGVETKEINQAVRNNPEKFPEGYVITLSAEEKAELVTPIEHLRRLKYSPYLPKVFTEKGLYMLATVLKGVRAIQTTIAIIEAFAKLRELGMQIRLLNETADEELQKSRMERSGELIADLLDNELEIKDTETTMELNLAVLKIKHSVRKGRKIQTERGEERGFEN